MNLSRWIGAALWKAISIFKRELSTREGRSLLLMASAMIFLGLGMLVHILVGLPGSEVKVLTPEDGEEAIINFMKEKYLHERDETSQEKIVSLQPEEEPEKPQEYEETTIERLDIEEIFPQPPSPFKRGLYTLIGLTLGTGLVISLANSNTIGKMNALIVRPPLNIALIHQDMQERRLANVNDSIEAPSDVTIESCESDLDDSDLVFDE